MGQTLHIRSAGLVTNVNALAAPEGAMSEALNVVIERPGVARPRPGLPVTTLTATIPANHFVYQAYYWDDTLIYVTHNGGLPGAGATRVASQYNSTLFSRFGTSDTAWMASLGCVHFAEMGGNLYFTTDNGVFRITSKLTAAAYRAGLERPKQTFTGLVVSAVGDTQVNYPYANGYVAAYRCVMARKVNDRWIRSAPLL